MLPVKRPILFNVQTRQPHGIDNALFPNPYSLRDFEWRKDGRAFTFEYNERGHQVYRAIRPSQLRSSG